MDSINPNANVAVQVPAAQKASELGGSPKNLPLWAPHLGLRRIESNWSRF